MRKSSLWKSSLWKSSLCRFAGSSGASLAARVAAAAALAEKVAASAAAATRVVAPAVSPVATGGQAAWVVRGARMEA